MRMTSISAAAIDKYAAVQASRVHIPGGAAGSVLNPKGSLAVVCTTGGAFVGDAPCVSRLKT